MKRLIYCLDGTNSTYDAAYPTNVVMTHKSIAAEDSSGIKQIAYYDEGVGTGSGARLWGLAFGYGLMDNILEAYAHLSLNYEPGDEIFIFGFSRGAYTARSLVGLIGLCGILKAPTASLIEQAHQFYQRRLQINEFDASELASWRLHNCQAAAVDQAEFDRRAQSAVPCITIIRIRYIGVWDTVKTLGTNEEKYRWHNHSLSEYVDFARHAAALDERRIKFNIIAWDNLDDLNSARGFRPDAAETPYRQVWFPGDHGSVGGGGPIRGLSDGALEWIIDGARQAGLALRDHQNAPAFDIVPKHLAPLENTPKPDWYQVHKHIARWAINLFGHRDRNGPNRMSELSHSAELRYYCPPNLLPEGKLYRPGSLAKLSAKLDAKPAPYTLSDYQSLSEDRRPNARTTEDVQTIIMDAKEHRVHAVEKGDTLPAISAKYLGDGARSDEIVALNAATINNPDRLYVGQKILIPRK